MFHLLHLLFMQNIWTFVRIDLESFVKTIVLFLLLLFLCICDDIVVVIILKTFL